MTRRFINLASINIRPDRIRKEFPEDLNVDLQESIRAQGLLQPIILSLEGDSYWLEAGERRLRAVSDIYALGGTFTYESEPVPSGLIPYLLLTDLSEIDRLQIEVDENTRRLDFTWQERAVATDKLARLRALQALKSNDPIPTTAEVGAEAFPEFHPKAAAAAARKDIILAAHLNDPEVRSAKSADDAFKALKRKESLSRNEALAAQIGASLTAASHRIINADSLEWMTAQPSNSYDIIITDPPFGMGADDFGDSGGAMQGAHRYDDSLETASICYATLAVEGFRLAAAEAHLYAFCDIVRFPHLYEVFTNAGWRVFRTPLLWVKPSAYRAPWPEHGPQRKYEAILYAIKGDKKTLKLAGDVLTHKPDENLGHSAQKPVALYQDLLSRSAVPGSRVLDPFAGTGPVIPAAHALKCLATAVEMDAASYGIIATRTKNL